jgi:hypothetical protein
MAALPIGKERGDSGCPNEEGVYQETKRPTIRTRFGEVREFAAGLERLTI